MHPIAGAKTPKLAQNVFNPLVTFVKLTIDKMVMARKNMAAGATILHGWGRKEVSSRPPLPHMMNITVMIIPKQSWKIGMKTA